MQYGAQPSLSFVTIGISQYLHWPTVDHAVNNAIATARVFTELGCVPAIEPLLDSAATRDALHRLATVDLAHLTPNDSLVVFFAGHGHTHTAEFSDVAVKTAYMIPVDGVRPERQAGASWLRLDNWLSDLARLPPRHILVMIDACDGGVTLGDLNRWRDEGSWPALDANAQRERRSRRVIVSALDGQRAMSHDPYPGHSLFTGCLVEGLSGRLATRGQRVTTGRELGQYLRARITAHPQSTQTPDSGAFELDDRGDIVLPVLSQHEMADAAGRMQSRPPAGHPAPPRNRAAASHAPTNIHAPTWPSSPPSSLLSFPPGSVEVAAPTGASGAPSSVDGFAGWRRHRRGAVAIALFMLGICAAIGLAVTRDPAPPGQASTGRRLVTTPKAVANDDGHPTDNEMPPSGSPPTMPSTPPAARPKPRNPGEVDTASASNQVNNARIARKKALEEDQKVLRDHIERQLARSRHDERYFSYRILRGQLFLLTVMQNTGLPSAEYLPALRGYVENQLALIKELQAVQSTRGLPAFLGFGQFAPGDQALAQHAGLQLPGHYSFVSPHLVMRDLATLLVLGKPPFFDSSLPMRIKAGDSDMTESDPICYSKLDPAWSGQAIRLLDDALRDIATNVRLYKERETMRTLQEYAHIYLALGQPKQAIAKLQTALSTYPRAEEFDEVQRELEEILGGETAESPCRDPR